MQRDKECYKGREQEIRRVLDTKRSKEGIFYELYAVQHIYHGLEEDMRKIPIGGGRGSSNKERKIVTLTT